MIFRNFCFFRKLSRYCEGFRCIFGFFPDFFSAEVSLFLGRVKYVRKKNQYLKFFSFFFTPLVKITRIEFSPRAFIITAVHSARPKMSPSPSLQRASRIAESFSIFSRRALASERTINKTSEGESHDAIGARAFSSSLLRATNVHHTPRLFLFPGKNESILKNTY